MARGIRKRYQKQMRNHFPRAASMFPITQKVKLGDYGFYHKGMFLPKGNIFNDFDLNFDDYVSQRLEDSAEANFLIHSEKYKSIKLNSEASEGKFKISLCIEFNSKKSFLIHLLKLKTDNIILKRALEQKVKELAEQKIWIDEYRLVVQRRVTNAIKFAYSILTNSKITLFGEAETENIPLGELNLNIDYQNTENIKADFWVEGKQNIITPLVSFAKFSTHGFEPVVRYLTLEDEQDFQLYEEPRLILDNSESFVDLEESEDEIDD